uniref:Reverse transcriptase Ty1/copia-type domain-containing protein n=1 Tax=Solanum lycopersicum TaxID=4081 RepID=A0A3Q7EXN8_SOLLC
MVVILVYVDDMLVIGSNLGLIEHTKAILHKAFKIKDLGDLKFFLGMEFSRSAKGILMNQMKYALEIISDLGLGNAKPAWTPLEANVRLTIQELDHLTGEVDDELFEDKEQYQRLIGKMLYLTMTRPNIAYSVQTFSQFLLQPKRSHWEAAVRVMKYIKREPGLGVILSSKRSNKLNVYCDADWAACPNTRRSVSGFLVKHGETLLSWKSKKQNVVSRSSAEAEYRSMANEVSELVWIDALLKELGSEVEQPAIQISEWGSNSRIAKNETSIIIGKAKEGPQLGYLRWSLPILNGFHLVSVHPCLTMTDCVSEELDSRLRKATLLPLHTQVIVAQNLKHFAQVWLSLGNQLNLMINFPSGWQSLGKFFRHQVPIFTKDLINAMRQWNCLRKLLMPPTRATRKVGSPLLKPLTICIADKCIPFCGTRIRGTTHEPPVSLICSWL